jgi:hypothetical protein
MENSAGKIPDAAVGRSGFAQRRPLATAGREKEEGKGGGG